MCLRDADTGQRLLSGSNEEPCGETIEVGLDLLAQADTIIGHNILNFDIPALEKVYPSLKVDRTKALDTLILARVLWPEIKQGDLLRWKKGTMPGGLIGRQGLEAWGHRLGEAKGEYTDWCKANGIKDPWSSWSPEMQRYCDQDTMVNWKLWERIRAKNLDPRCIRLEHDTALLGDIITTNGFPFNRKAAGDLYQSLQARRDAALHRLQTAFPPIEARTVFIPKANNKPRGYLKGVPIERVEMVPFNPSSGDDVAARLTAKYGWAPTQWTPGTFMKPLAERVPQVTEAILEGLDYPEVPDLLDHMLHAKIASFLVSGTKGDKGWLHIERNGRIHTQYATAGAVTGRATHSRPNIAQVPKVAKGKAGILKGADGGYGWECRGLFGAPPGWFLVGADMSGLELRCLAHYLAPLDEGRYVRLVCEGDVHTANQEAAGLPTRDNAKTFIYGFLYGAGAWKVGHIVSPSASDEEKERTGKKLVNQFLKGTTGLKLFRDTVKATVAPAGTTTKLKMPDGSTKVVHGKGCLRGLDGRPLTIRKAHAAVNTLLQSAGAILCKEWIVNIVKTLNALGYSQGWDGDFAVVAWVHDEIQIACRTHERAEQAARVCEDEAAKAGTKFNFKCPTAGEAKIGLTWAETH